jgi:hypothetical protein
MHPSYFMILNDKDINFKKELSLFPEVSEWLFFTKFWDEFNQNHGTFFGQYEEELLLKNLASNLAKELGDLSLDLQEKSEGEFKFCYAWNGKEEQFYCSINSETIALEINKLVKLVTEASDLNSDIYCQL